MVAVRRKPCVRFQIGKDGLRCSIFAQGQPERASHLLCPPQMPRRRQTLADMSRNTSTTKSAESSRRKNLLLAKPGEEGLHTAKHKEQDTENSTHASRRKLECQ